MANEPVFRKEGETVILKAGIPHKFWNAGIEPLPITMEVNPVDNIIYILSRIYESITENGGNQPGAFDAAYLLTRYKSEIDLLEIPPFVRKFIFPVTLLIGKISGKYKKFKDSPPPV